jgi:chromosome segregation ATPase
MQVEETLNNSNDLFLTFRKEMEEMSKKTKRLEKENANLARNKEITNRNIAEMVDERTKMQEALTRKDKEIEDQRRRIATLEGICRKMQAQGRGQVPLNDHEDEGVTDSEEYDYEDEDEEGSGDYDEDTEEDVLETVHEPRPFGPVPPPPPPPQNLVNGTHNGQRQVNGQVNGVKR